jgi:hypothetical protein
MSFLYKLSGSYGSEDLNCGFVCDAFTCAPSLEGKWRQDIPVMTLYRPNQPVYQVSIITHFILNTWNFAAEQMLIISDILVHTLLEQYFL